VLLIDSGWGFAPLAETAAALSDAGAHVLAVAGRNRAAERQLRDVAASKRNVIPFGYTSQVPALMAAADLVVALPGAATCAEARVIGRRLLLLDVMPGHGRDNLLHELERGNAGVCGPAASDIRVSALALLDTAPGDVPRVPRWEPLFAAALKTIGLEIEPRWETASCAPSS
jgi:UDP-N-acetylglucosamine:LPS N-acetylglucosamine transferase